MCKLELTYGFETLALYAKILHQNWQKLVH
jgi:hypothetical protein